MVCTCTYTLNEFTVPSPRHGGVISAVDFCNVISFDVTDFVHR